MALPVTITRTPRVSLVVEASILRVCLVGVRRLAFFVIVIGVVLACLPMLLCFFWSRFGTWIILAIISVTDDKWIVQIVLVIHMWLRGFYFRGLVSLPDIFGLFSGGVRSPVGLLACLLNRS